MLNYPVDTLLDTRFVKVFINFFSFPQMIMIPVRQFYL